MNKYIFTLLLLIFSSHVLSSENPLIGKWLSDKDKTQQSILSSKNLSNEQKKLIIENIEFGKLIIEFQDNLIISQYDGEKDVQNYKVVSRNGANIVIQEYSKLMDQEISTTIKLDKNTLYLPSETNPNIVEVFNRIQ